MILGEPPRTAYDLKFVLAGIPVRVHPLFWLVALLLGAFGDSTLEQLVAWVGAVFVSILVHELGHALVASGYGWRPWITLYGFGGLTSYHAVYTGPWKRILVAAAGPGAGFLFAFLVTAVVVISGSRAQFGPWDLGQGEPILNPTVGLLVDYLLFINILWGTINLLPVYPLDGGQIARVLLLTFNPRRGIRQSLWLSTVTAGGLALFSLLGLGSLFMTLLFAALAYGSYTELQGYGGGPLGGAQRW